MNKKEKNELALSMAVLMDSVLDKNLNSEEIANSSIKFCIHILNEFPEIRKLVERMINDDWDTQISWIDFEKNMLK